MWKLLPILLVTFAATPAFAGAGPWQEIAPGVNARLIAGGELVDGVAQAGLELDLPAGTKTYWRIPGETGIPTEIDFSASTGVSEASVHWPFPEIDRSEGYLDYVYTGRVVLPFEFRAAPDAGAVLVTRVTLGVCSEICIPATASLELPLDFAARDEAQAIRLEQAMAEVPTLWDQPGPPFSHVEVGFDGSLHLIRPNDDIDPATLIADVGDPGLLFETPQKSPDGRLWTLKPLGKGAVEGLEGRSVQLTFRTPRGPYAVSRTVAPSQP